MYNRNNTSKELKKLAKNKKAYENIFQTPSGKIVLKDLFDNSFINMGKYCKDSNENIFMEGKRGLVLHILSMIKMPFEEYLNMYMKEGEEINEFYGNEL